MSKREGPGNGFEPWLVLLLSLATIYAFDWDTLQYGTAGWYFLIGMAFIVIMGMIFIYDHLYSNNGS